MAFDTATLQLKLSRFSESNRKDFDQVICTDAHAGTCHCVAWWVDNWDNWSERTSEQNKALRDELCTRGEYDGYLLYVDRRVAGWMQAGPRDRLAKLVKQYELEPEEGTWAVTCFVLDPKHRGKGLSTYMLHQALADMRNRGVKAVEAFPNTKAKADDELWTGPESVFQAAGFELSQKDPGPVYRLTL